MEHSQTRGQNSKPISGTNSDFAMVRLFGFIVFDAKRGRFDTLLFGARSSIPLVDTGGRSDYERRLPRPLASRSDCEEFLLNIVSNVEIHLASERVDPDTGNKRLNFKPNGETHKQTEGPTIIYFSHEILEPLLNKNITVSERRLSDFRVASTLIHEVSVIIFCSN
jgi:hypothetical protein